MDEILYKPIGYIRSEYEDITDMPKSSKESLDQEAQLIVDEKYLESMADIRSGEEYMIIFHFHKSKGYSYR